ncbi:hypothetical protein, partial [Ralstonia solanacearum]
AADPAMPEPAAKEAPPAASPAPPSAPSAPSDRSSPEDAPTAAAPARDTRHFVAVGEQAIPN